MKTFLSTALLIMAAVFPLAAQTGTAPQDTSATPPAAAQRNSTAPRNQATSKTQPQKEAAAQKNDIAVSKTGTQQHDTAQRDNAAGLPAEYRGIQLGMTIDTVKEALKKDAIFGYRGDRDVSLLPVENRSLIESAGFSFISRSWFQFYKENLYTMIFKLNTDIIDYYSIYTRFCERYGEPLAINPQRAVWEDEHTRIVIERPLIVKYIDLTVFNELLSKSTTEQAASSVNRQSFIDGF